MRDPFVRSVVLRRDEVEDLDAYPFSIPAIRALPELELDARVTLTAGENGSGKSTLIEAVAVAAGSNPEGGSRTMRMATRASHSPVDEPEAALSLRGNLVLMRRIHDLVADGSQFVVSTHSPILLGYPHARVYVLSEEGIVETAYEDTEQYELTRSFLDDRGRFLHHLFADD